MLRSRGTRAAGQCVPAPRLRPVESAAARPRGAHLPGRVLRPARPRDLERHLVRRPLHAHLQRAVPAAGGAAAIRYGRVRWRRSPAHVCSIGWCAAAGASAPLRRVWWFAALGIPGPARERLAGVRPGVALALAACARCSPAGPGSPAPSPHSARWQPGRGRCCAGAGRRAARRRRRCRGPSRSRRGSGALPVAVLALAVPRERRQLPVLVLGLLAAGAHLCAARCSSFVACRRSATRGSCASATWRSERCSGSCPIRSAATSRASGRCSPARCSPPCCWRGRARPPRALAVAVLALALGVAGDHAAARHAAEPRRSLDGALLLRAAQQLAGRPRGERDRIEIPYTFNHWETAYVSPRFALARGWLRQLDRERNSLFYEGRLTDASATGHGCSTRASATSRCPDAELDYSAEKEADLVRAAQPYLRQRAVLKHWRVYEVIPGSQPARRSTRRAAGEPDPAVVHGRGDAPAAGSSAPSRPRTGAS